MKVPDRLTWNDVVPVRITKQSYPVVIFGRYSKENVESLYPSDRALRVPNYTWTSPSNTGSLDLYVGYWGLTAKAFLEPETNELGEVVP